MGNTAQDNNLKKDAGPGRPKRSKNRLRYDMVQKVMDVAQALDAAGIGLEAQAKKDPQWFYGQFGRAVMPKDIKIGIDEDTAIAIKKLF